MADDILARWFQGEIEYSGLGFSRFVSPAGRIEGHAVVRFDERGGKTITVQVEKLETDEPMAYGLTELLSGRKTMRDGKVVGRSFGIELHSCNELVVETTAGRFMARGDIHYGYRAERHRAARRPYPGEERARRGVDLHVHAAAPAGCWRGRDRPMSADGTDGDCFHAELKKELKA